MVRTRASAASPRSPGVVATAAAAPLLPDPLEEESEDEEHQPVPQPPPPAPAAAAAALVAVAAPVVPANRLWATIVEELELENSSLAAAMAEKSKNVKWGAALAPTAAFLRLTDAQPYDSHFVLENYGDSPDFHYFLAVVHGKVDGVFGLKRCLPLHVAAGRASKGILPCHTVSPYLLK